MRISRLFIAMFVTCLFYKNCLSMDPIVKEIKKDIHHARQDIGTLISIIAPTIGETIRGEELIAITNNRYKNTDAYVRQGTGISEGEKEYRKKRFPIVKAAIETLLKRELQDHQVINIAVINSGGGCRAAFCTAGSLAGAEKIGLLNATTYVTALSGSTGMIAPWISTKKPLPEFKEYIKTCISKSFIDPTDEEESLIYDAAAVKSHFRQPKTPVDLYGDLIGNRLLEGLGENRHMVYLSDMTDIIQDGTYPYPILTAVDATETREAMLNPIWYGLTPHEIEDHHNNIHIPTWAFGRKFKNGESHKGKHTIYPPEKNLSFILGTCWSAPGASVFRIKKELGKALGIEHFLEDTLTSLDSQRLDFYAKVPNYAYKLNHTKKEEPKIKSFVDAGTHFNLPIPPVSGLCKERKADVMIICDASAGEIGNELRKAAEYMAKNNLPFPKINFENIDKKTISVFKEKDPTVPVVVYLPRISDQKLWNQHKSNSEYTHYNLTEFDLDYETNHRFAQTIHFQYAPENAQKIMDQTEFNMRINETKIIKAIEFAVNRKKLGQ